MTPIYVDYNARTANDRVRLSTLGSVKSLRVAPAEVGTWVWVSDGEVRAGARIEEAGGELLAAVAWPTCEEVPAEGADPDDVRRALIELRAEMAGSDRDYRRVLALVARASPQLRPGDREFYRSRAMLALGYPELALLAADEALAVDRRPTFVLQRFEALRRVDPRRASEDARRLLGDAPQDLPPIVAACAQAIDAYSRHLIGAERAQLLSELIDRTNTFAASASTRPAAPPMADSTAAVLLVRGFALLHLGERERAIDELRAATRVNPQSAEAWAALGLESYPSEEATLALEQSVKLEIPSYWPAYYLAHARLRRGAWKGVEELAEHALSFAPPAHVRATLLEWRAIARFEQDGDAPAARVQLTEALNVWPESPHIQANLAVAERLTSPHVSPHVWDEQLPVRAVTSELRVAA